MGGNDFSEYLIDELLINTESKIYSGNIAGLYVMNYNVSFMEDHGILLHPLYDMML